MIGEVLSQARALHGGVPAGDGEPLELWHGAVAELRRRNVLVAVLIDAAASLASGYLGDLAKLLEGEAASTAVRILLAGGENLKAALAGTGLPEHLGVYCTLGAMAQDEVPAYVGHRLGVASGHTELRFTGPALELIAAWSRGIPRLINVAADAALLSAYRANEREVSRVTVAQAIRDALGGDLPADPG